MEINLINNVPNIYVDESRDFQLYLRLLNIIIGGTKYTIDSIVDIFDPFICNNKVLDLLCTTFNFNPKTRFTDEDLRILLSGFGSLIKNKGTLRGIEQAISLIFKMSNITSEYTITIVNNTGSPIKSDNYFIEINIGDEINLNYLNELLEYVKPVGYTVSVHLIIKSSSDSEIKNLSEIKGKVNEPIQVSNVTNPQDNLNKVTQVIESIAITKEEYDTWNLNHSILSSSPLPTKFEILPGDDHYKENYDTWRIEYTTFDALQNIYSLNNKYISIPKVPADIYNNTLNRLEVVKHQPNIEDVIEDVNYNIEEQ